MSDTVDAAASVAHLVGTIAKAALTSSNTALAILTGAQRMLSIFGVAFPPAAVAANDLQLAIPIIAAIAEYAPVVENGIQQGRPFIDMVTEIGTPLFEKLGNLESLFPGIVIGEVIVADFLKANEFTPQDPRFSRDDASEY